MSSKTQLLFLFGEGRGRKTKPNHPLATISRVCKLLLIMTPLACKLDLVQDAHVEDRVDLLKRIAGQDVHVCQATREVEEDVEVLLVKRPDL